MLFYREQRQNHGQLTLQQLREVELRYFKVKITVNCSDESNG